MVSVKVLFEYEATQEDELTLQIGDIVRNVDQQDGGWWEGDLNGKRGMFPENFVEVIKEDNVTSQDNGGRKTELSKAKVTFQYEPEQDDELALEVGDVIEILDDEDDGWWKGRLNGKVGVFPSNFVEKISKSSTDPTLAVTSPTISEPAPTETEFVDKNRPKSVSGMGFGLTIGDLSRNKLKKVVGSKSGETQPTKKEESNKPAQTVPPPGLPKSDNEKKLPPSITASSAIKTIQKAKAMFAYEPELEDELRLNIGDIIVITNKNVFEGWMQGELNGKTGLFPDNFVELLPVETVKDDQPGLSIPKDITSKKSIKRAAKEDPSKTDLTITDPSKINSLDKKPEVAVPLVPPGGLAAKLELEKKKPSPGDVKKPSTTKGPAPPPPPLTSKKPKPALPVQPKPGKLPAPVITKPSELPAASTPQPIAASAISGLQHEEAHRSSSVSFPENTGKLPNLARTQSESLKRSGPPHQTEKLEEENNDTENKELDLDAVKPTDPLKHMQRVKPPSKNPPSKFKDGNSKVSEVNSVDNSKELIELRKQVSDLEEKMAELEKKFKKLILQVTEDLDSERKNRLNQQVEIDRLKKQLNLLN